MDRTIKGAALSAFVGTVALCAVAWAASFPAQGSASGAAALPEGCVLYKDANQSVPDATETLVTWESTHTDPNNWHAAPATTVTAAAGRTLTFAASGNTITASTGDFTSDGYTLGMLLTVAGTSSNNGTYTVSAVSALVVTVTSGITNEGPLSATATLNAVATRITPGAAGTYLVTACLPWAFDAQGRRQIEILVNGSLWSRMRESGITSTQGNYCQSAMLVKLTATTDYIEIRGYHAAGNALNLLGGTISDAQVSVERIN